MARLIRETPDDYAVLGGEDIHVYPLFGREHDVDHGIYCWCEPERDREEPRVIMHRPEQ